MQDADTDIQIERLKAENRLLRAEMAAIEEYVDKWLDRIVIALLMLGINIAEEA